jgi:hypothetical protein
MKDSTIKVNKLFVFILFSFISFFIFIRASSALKVKIEGLPDRVKPGDVIKGKVVTEGFAEFIIETWMKEDIFGKLGLAEFAMLGLWNNAILVSKEEDMIRDSRFCIGTNECSFEFNTLGFEGAVLITAVAGYTYRSANLLYSLASSVAIGGLSIKSTQGISAGLEVLSYVLARRIPEALELLKKGVEVTGIFPKVLGAISLVPILAGYTIAYTSNPGPYGGVSEYSLVGVFDVHQFKLIPIINGVEDETVNEIEYQCDTVTSQCTITAPEKYKGELADVRAKIVISPKFKAGYNKYNWFVTSLPYWFIPINAPPVEKCLDTGTCLTENLVRPYLKGEYETKYIFKFKFNPKEWELGETNSIKFKGSVINLNKETLEKCLANPDKNLKFCVKIVGDEEICKDEVSVSIGTPIHFIFKEPHKDPTILEEYIIELGSMDVREYYRYIPGVGKGYSGLSISYMKEIPTSEEYVLVARVSDGYICSKPIKVNWVKPTLVIGESKEGETLRITSKTDPPYKPEYLRFVFYINDKEVPPNCYSPQAQSTSLSFLLPSPNCKEKLDAKISVALVNMKNGEVIDKKTLSDSVTVECDGSSLLYNCNFWYYPVQYCYLGRCQFDFPIPYVKEDTLVLQARAYTGQYSTEKIEVASVVPVEFTTFYNSTIEKSPDVSTAKIELGGNYKLLIGVGDVVCEKEGHRFSLSPPLYNPEEYDSYESHTLYCKAEFKPSKERVKIESNRVEIDFKKPELHIIQPKGNIVLKPGESAVIVAETNLPIYCGFNPSNFKPYCDVVRFKASEPLPHFKILPAEGDPWVNNEVEKGIVPTFCTELRGNGAALFVSYPNSPFIECYGSMNITAYLQKSGIGAPETINITPAFCKNKIANIEFPVIECGSLWSDTTTVGGDKTKFVNYGVYLNPGINFISFPCKSPIIESDCEFKEFDKYNSVLLFYNSSKNQWIGINKLSDLKPNLGCLVNVTNKEKCKIKIACEENSISKDIEINPEISFIGTSKEIDTKDFLSFLKKNCGEDSEIVECKKFNEEAFQCSEVIQPDKLVPMKGYMVSKIKKECTYNIAS